MVIIYYLKLLYQGMKILVSEGPRSMVRKGRKYYRLTHQYDIWMELNEKDLSATEPLSYRPLISVVVPVYNVKSPLLAACIDSVLAQTYDNWELILVDDCSTMDSVRETLREYEKRGDSRIRILYRERNGHISRCTNTGIEAATGEFIGLVDCDDTLPSTPSTRSRGC